MPARTDPPVSQAQRAAMHAAAEGKSTLGIPKSVGEEFSEADPGGKLPAHKADSLPSGWRISTGRDGKFYLWRGTTPITKNGKGFETKAEAETYAATFSRKDASNGDPADITRATERMDAIVDSLREVGRRMDAAGGEAEGKRLDAFTKESSMNDLNRELAKLRTQYRKQRVLGEGAGLKERIEKIEQIIRDKGYHP